MSENVNKELLIKYFSGQATEEEMDLIFKWLGESEENRNNFAKEKAMWTVVSHEMISEADMERSGADADRLVEMLGQREPARTGRATVIFRFIYSVSAAVILILLVLNLSRTGREFSEPLPPLQLADMEKYVPYFIDAVASEKDSYKADSLMIMAPSQRPVYSVYTNKGVKANLVLPDGTKVWLNSDSRIEYPQVFTGDKRRVKLSGEAYFDVVSNKEMPMLIQTQKDLSVEVKGTTLSIKSYDNDNEVRTNLFTGEVELKYRAYLSNQEKTYNLKPMESFIFYEDKAPVHILKSDTEKQLAWKDGKLLFDNTPMEEVIKMIERWHGAKFIVENNNIYKYSISATFESESLVQVMNIIRLMIPVKVDVSKNIVRIY